MSAKEDADLEREIARQERIVELETCKLIGLYSQRDMRQLHNMKHRDGPRP